MKSNEAVRSFPLQPRGFLFIDRFRRLFDQANDVAHAENPAGEALRHKGFELIELFAGAGELDRPLGDFAHRQRRAASRVAVELGQNDAGDRSASLKWVATLTACWPVAASTTSKISCGFKNSFELLEFLDQRVVDLLATGRIENLDVAAPAAARATPDASAAARCTFFSSGSGVKTGTSICLPSVASCSIAAGRCKSQRDQIWRCVPAFSEDAPAWPTKLFCPSR